MAVGWFRTVHRLHGYFCKVKRDQKRSWRKLDMNNGDNHQHQYHNNRANAHHNRHSSSSQIAQGNLYEELKQLDRVLMELGSTEDQTPEMNGSDDDVAAMLSANLVEHSETANNIVKSEPGDGPDAPHGSDVNNHNHAVNGSLQRESWVPVNNSNPVHSLVTPHSLSPMTTAMTSNAVTATTSGPATAMIMMSNGCKEQGEKSTDCDRWPILPAPQQHHPSTTAPSTAPSYSLPPFQSSYRDTPSSGLPASPPSSAGTTLPPPVPSTTAHATATVTATTTAASSPYFPATPSPSNSNSNHRLQAVQPWPTSRQPPPPPYSQSLPSLNLAAQQSFPLPPLQPSLTHCGQAHGHGHGHGHGLGHGHAQCSSNRTPPLSQSRLDLGAFLAPPLTQQQYPQQQPQHQPSSRHVSPYMSYDGANAHPLWMSSLSGEDVLAFVEADSFDKWSTTIPASNGPPSPASMSNMNGNSNGCGTGSTSNANGWLGLIWSEYTH
ncbi:hypothetical protein FQN49_007836 [Arthroderma sp. PD_2]|nr:hypothetical protein FQN49_007836 [Arthroderma sp. PD_2]